MLSTSDFGSSTSSSAPPRPDLPHWIFDVDEDDDPLDLRQNSSLLQELEIDLEQIGTCIAWMFTAPWRQLFSRPSVGAHPIHRATNVDFWGPCFCVTTYGTVLWFCNVRDVPWIYIIWTLGGIFNHLTARVWFNTSTLLLHLAILGYSISPLIPMALLIALARPPLWVASCIEFVALLWAAFAAHLSYRLVCRPTGSSTQPKPRVPLLTPPIVLMQMYFISVLPVREVLF